MFASVRFVTVATLLFVLADHSAQAQGAFPQRRGEIRGLVVNAAAKAAIPGATVEVTLAGAETPAGRAVTAANGTFRVIGLALGRYRVFIRALGFRPVEVQAVDIVSASPRTGIGSIAPTVTAIELQAVEVIVNKQDVLLAPDRNTFTVKDMPTTRGGNALDVLKNVPSVDVDIDNIVSLRGNSAVTVQINGRPSPMKPAQLGNYLSQLPADMVAKEEIIPNPSARNPTGSAGIINLVMKQKADRKAYSETLCAHADYQHDVCSRGQGRSRSMSRTARALKIKVTGSPIAISMPLKF